MSVRENKAVAYEHLAAADSEYSTGSTVVAVYEPEAESASAYQSEAELERLLLEQLKAQAYEHVPVRSEAELVANLRHQLELLNETQFSDTEWEQFFRTVIANERDTIADKADRIQGDGYLQELVRDDGSVSNIKLIDRVHMHNNRLQVINQYEVSAEQDAGETAQAGSKYGNRFDVTVLVNGLPMVHIELKRRGVPLREAFNQIRRYGRDAFWTGRALFDYVQIFVISNGTLTKYYSNTTRWQHVEQAKAGRSLKKQTSNSFEFTSWWADAENQPIQELRAFTRTFFAKHTLLAVLTRYCILTYDKTLMVMRPYQIAACEQILRRIETASNYKQWGTVEAGGYIWHTTGSGKTLTSFKTAQLATRLSSVDKVLFVVDRKDLDYQTMKEYDRFEKGAANSNTSTAVLKRQLEDPNARIIITTIHKLSHFIKSNPAHAVYAQHVVMIFDECHRSQFGDMHAAITRSFRKYHLFGFTGTPIFAVNAPTRTAAMNKATTRSSGPSLLTTEQVFGDKLHTYTIVDAIRDKNVLPFMISYVNTIRTRAEAEDAEVAGINTESALLAPERVRQVTSYILEHFDRKTKRAFSYDFQQLLNVSDVASAKSSNKVAEIRKSQRVHGFNAMLATASITAARAYYREFQAQQAQLVPDKRLRVATIFSFAPNPEADGISMLPDESMDPSDMARDDRDFLEDAIGDYNALFNTNYDTSSDSFENYYKDLSLRVKNREVDLVIVVNMFLTGFDATTLNTLFVDKNLRYHGLIQAFSRTNRVLNSVKTFGNIVSFRNLEDETNDAISLFGNKDAHGIVLMKSYAEHLAEYQSAVNTLLADFPLGVDGSVPVIDRETDQKHFIQLFGGILRLHNILVSFDEFVDPHRADNPLSPRMLQDYQSLYLDLYQDRRSRQHTEDEPIDEDVVFEIELIKQVEINVDYILMLVEQYRRDHGDGDDTHLRSEISRAVDASPTLRNKKDLVEAFVDAISAHPDTDIDVAWRQFIEDRKNAELEEIITNERLRAEPARAFMEQTFRDGELRTAGTEIVDILPRVSRFATTQEHSLDGIKQRVIETLTQFFERFFGLVVSGEDR